MHTLRIRKIESGFQVGKRETVEGPGGDYTYFRTVGLDKDKVFASDTSALDYAMQIAGRIVLFDRNVTIELPNGKVITVSA